MTKKLAAFFFVLTVLAACCGEGKGNDSSSTEQGSQSEAGESENAPPSNPADQAIADSALLTLDDFPAGWEAQPAGADDDDQESQTRIAECAGVDFEDLYSGDSGASADSETFVSATDEEISNTVKVATDEGWAANAFEVASGPKFRECMLEETEKLVDEAVAGEDAIEIGDPSINEISFEDYGDDTLAFRLTIPLEAEGLSLEVTSDFILVRVGRAQTTVTSQSTGAPFDVEALSGFTQVAADRLAQELNERRSIS